MRKNNWLVYFVYSLILLCYIMLSNQILSYIDKQSQITFDALPFIIWSSVLYVILGLLLGLDKLLLEIRKEGKWEVNLPKVLFLGIPSFYFSIGMFIYFCPIDFVRQVLAGPIILLLKSKVEFIPIFQMIFGFTISTSFIKVKG